MSDTDLIKAAQQLLTSRASFETLVSKSRFISTLSHIDESINEDVAIEIYEALAVQNNRRLKEANYKLNSELGSIQVSSSQDDQLKEHTKDDDHLPLEDADRDTLETVVRDLESLNKSIVGEIQETDQKCSMILNEINERIDSLSDLKYGKIDFMSSTSESYESLKRLETKLMEKIKEDIST